MSGSEGAHANTNTGGFDLLKRATQAMMMSGSTSRYVQFFVMPLCPATFCSYSDPFLHPFHISYYLSLYLPMQQTPFLVPLTPAPASWLNCFTACSVKAVALACLLAHSVRLAL